MSTREDFIKDLEITANVVLSLGKLLTEEEKMLLLIEMMKEI